MISSDVSGTTFPADGRMKNDSPSTTMNMMTVPENSPLKLYMPSNTEPIRGPNRKPNENIDRRTVLAITSRLERYAYIDSRAEAYSCGMEGAPSAANRI